MGGGLLQLVAYGAQDVYLTGNPQITFFKVVYRRHTNFSIESIVQSHNGNVGFGNRMTCQISRNGDLLHKLYLQIDVSGTTTNHICTQNLGHYLIKTAEIEIGGQLIDRQYGVWMQIWNELTLPEGKKTGFDKMIGNYITDTFKLEAANSNKTTLYIPFEFWFCRNVGLALPLIALQYHEVKINITFNEQITGYTDSGGGAATETAGSNLTLTNATLWADYIFLDTDERRRFAQLSHEYLIEQVQFTGTETATADSKTRIKMSFNHPVKELIWVNMDPAKKRDWCAWQTQITDKVELQLNGNDRFSARDPKYFTHVQPYQHHTNIPANIGVYSFALKPEEHQPSGTLNMSRIDTAQITIPRSSASGNIYLFAHSYNVLRILSGMGGLAYSN
jgi:hypothetical protein